MPVVTTAENTSMPRGLPPEGPVEATDPDSHSTLSGSVARMASWPVHYGPMNATTTFRHVDSPLGRIRLVGRDEVLTGLYLADHQRCPPPDTAWAADEDAFDGARRQLNEYFAGDRKEFTVPIDLEG